MSNSNKSVVLTLAFYVLALISMRAVVLAQGSDTIRGQALHKTNKLNEFSDYVPKVMSWTDAKLEELEKLRNEVAHMDPASGNYQAAVDDYEKKRNEFYAERANQETALIRFRDLADSTSRFLTDEEGRLRGMGLYDSLARALTRAENAIRRHDQNWDGRERRPQGLPDVAIGAPPEEVVGVPVLDVEYVETPPEVIDVDTEYAVRARFINNSEKWILAEVQLVAGGDATTVNPAKAQQLWIPPKSKSDTWSWTVSVSAGGEYNVTMTRQVKGYSPKP